MFHGALSALLSGFVSKVGGQYLFFLKCLFSNIGNVLEVTVIADEFLEMLDLGSFVDDEEIILGVAPPSNILQCLDELFSLT